MDESIIMAELTAMKSEFTAMKSEFTAMKSEFTAIVTERKAHKDFYTTSEVASMMGKDAYTVREWCRLGRVNASKRACGRGTSQEWVISNQELDRLKNHGLLPLRKQG